jgi:hypothetical protein
MLAIAAASFGYGLGSYTRITAVPAVPLPPGVTPMDAAVQSAQAQLADAAEDVKRIDRLVTILLALSSLYALGLGLHSYFGLKQILDTAKEDSKRAVQLAEQDSTRARQEFDQFREELRAKYPEMADLHANLREMVADISLFQARDNWAEHAYHRLNERRRQEMLMAEQWFAGLEVFRLMRSDMYRPEITATYQGFARFYSSKFSSEGRRGDWERAELYFRRALGSPEAQPALLKDYGVHLTQVEVSLLGKRLINRSSEGGAKAA